MSREFRRVSRTWQHPRDEAGEYIPLCRSHCRRGVCYQWYETVTEGTPLSPVCRTVEEMAQWFWEHETAKGVLRRDNGQWVEEPWTYEGVLAYVQQDEW